MRLDSDLNNTVYALTDEELATIRYYDLHAAEWAHNRKKSDQPSFWDEEFREFQMLQAPSGKVLELGSGSGREAMELVKIGYEYVGIDWSDALLKIASYAQPQSLFFKATPYALPFSQESFNAFFSWALLPHVPKRKIREALFELKRVLCSGACGFFAMREGIGEHFEEKSGRFFSYYTSQEFVDILTEVGFQVEKRGRKLSRPGLVWLTFFVRTVK